MTGIRAKAGNQADRRNQAIAYHEGGHAVAAVVLGGEIVEVWINPQGDTDGRFGNVRRYDPVFKLAKKLGVDPALGLAALPTSDEVICALGKNLTIAMAGPEAQRRHDPKSIRLIRHTKDAADIEALVGSFPKASQRAAFRQWGEENARKLIAKHWRSIDRVAEALLIHGRLTGDQIKDIIAV